MIPQGNKELEHIFVFLINTTTVDLREEKHKQTTSFFELKLCSYVPALIPYGLSK